MLLKNLTRVSSISIIICISSYLPVVLSIEQVAPSLSLLFNTCQKDSNPDDNGCSQCWTAGVSTDTLLPQEAAVVETTCPSASTSLNIQTRGAAWNWGRPPGGWAINDRDHFICDVHANLDWSATINSTRVAAVLQLCDLDGKTLCQPVIPPNDSFLTSDTGIRMQTESSPISVVKLLNLDMNGKVDLELEFSFGDVPCGTYRIMGSLIFSNETSIVGVSHIPTVQFLTVLDREPLEASSAVFTAIIVVSSVASTLILFLFCQTFINRNAQVFELTQGKFLLAMQLCALVATSSLVLFKPGDPACQVSTPIIFLSTHTVYAILLGRMWRVRAVISPLLLLTLEKKEDWTSKIVHWVNQFTACSSRQSRHQKKIRRKITDSQLARVILLLIMPQVIIQIAMLCLDNRMVVDEIARDGFVDEIFRCEYGLFHSILPDIAVSFIGIEFLMLLVLTYRSKDLPSLFNETTLVWAILRATFVLLIFGVSLVAATIDHYNTANIRFIVPALILGFNMCQVCWMITWSKLKVAWNGQTILVTKLIADHNFKKTKGMGMAKDGLSSGDSSEYTFLKRFSLSSPVPTKSPMQVQSPATPVMVSNNDGNGKDTESGDISDDGSTDSSVVLKRSEEVLMDDTSGDDPVLESSQSFRVLGAYSSPSNRRLGAFSPLNYFKSSAYQDLHVSQQELARRGSMLVRRRRLPQRESGERSGPAQRRSEDSGGRTSLFRKSTAPTSLVLESSIERNPRLHSSIIRITETEAPGRRLLLRMIDVERTLARVNRALLTGQLVNQYDWEDVRGGCVVLGEVFSSDVKFGWEDGMEASESSDIVTAPAPFGPTSPKVATSPADRKSATFSPSSAAAARRVVASAPESAIRSLQMGTPLGTIHSPSQETGDIDNESDGSWDSKSPLPDLESDEEDVYTNGMTDEESPALVATAGRNEDSVVLPNLGNKGDNMGEDPSEEVSILPIASPTEKGGSECIASKVHPSYGPATLESGEGDTVRSLRPNADSESNLSATKQSNSSPPLSPPEGGIQNDSQTARGTQLSGLPSEASERSQQNESNRRESFRSEGGHGNRGEWK
eukprot:scaffold20339_cov128-Cylindrotheca_fusiformis.AAC.3